MNKNPLIEKYGDAPRWVAWKLQTRKGQKTKVPYSLSGALASSTDPKTWSAYNEIKKMSPNAGIILTSDSPYGLLLGIDIDHCLKDNKIEHEQKEKIAELILEADTYTEVSPSKTGLHLFLGLTAPLSLSSNKIAPFEFYTSGRYFTFTGDVYGAGKDVRTVTPEEAERLLAILGYKNNTNYRTPSTSRKSTFNIPSNADLLKKIFSSKNGGELKRLYEGDASKYGNDISRADMALCSSLAFWTGRNFDQMEKIWLASPLGKREKVQDRQDYRTRTINAAIESCEEIYETKAERFNSQNPDLELLYVTGPKGTVTYPTNLENICRVLRRQNRFRFDNFKKSYEIKKDGAWHSIEDSDALDLQSEISIDFTDYFVMVTKTLVYDAMLKVAKENMIDSAVDYVKSLVWDKRPRLDGWLFYTYGSPINDYYRAVGSNWIKGLVKRIIEPGCKFDYVLVLEGTQGSKKSTSLSILGGDWYMETTMSTDSKDFFMQFLGKAIIEFSEGETLSRTEVKRMKAIITTQSDKYRPPYERSSQDFPRRCVFAMTTNDEEYLKDETGNRRWLPVRLLLEEANVEWLRENRDQLFAEAYYRLVVLKEEIYEFPKEDMLREQNARRVHYEHEDAIVYWYQHTLKDNDREQGITITQVYRDAIGGFSGKVLNKYDEVRIVDVLKNVLKLERKQVMIDNVRTRRWINELQVKVGEVVFKDENENW